MSVEDWLIATGTHLALCIAPGPAVVFVLGESMARGVRAGVQGTAGVVLANACYFGLAAGGLGGLLLASPQVFAAVRWLGAAYLVLAGVRTFRASGAGTSRTAPPRTRGDGARSLLRGLGVQLANPKASVFFLVFLPTLLDPAANGLRALGIIGIPLLAIQAATLIGYAFAADGVVGWLGHSTARVVVGRLSGALLVGFGLLVALSGVSPR